MRLMLFAQKRACGVRGFRLARLNALTTILSVAIALEGCGGASSPVNSNPNPPSGGVLENYKLTGAVSPVHDPSMIRQGSTYYVFSTDASPVGSYLQIRCSADKVNWTPCGHIFDTIPAWVTAKIPGIAGLWAPDVSYFNGLYHVYYAGSSFGTNTSVIGLVTNKTLDATEVANYQWMDQGEVLSSQSTDNFNAIDPNLFMDTDGRAWLTYGSFWTGIKQQEIDPHTGLLLTSNTAVYDLAARPGVQFDPIEGSSLVLHNGFYYLFVSFDFCCDSDPYQSNYKIAVGRGNNPHGPFFDQSNTDMLQGGGTILLHGNGTKWSAPGGQTAYLDANGESLVVFHALRLPGGTPYLFVNALTWPQDWPQIRP
jgi:arabinan endo-1,5-alpha-L-arabinosidase